MDYRPGQPWMGSTQACNTACWSQHYPNFLPTWAKDAKWLSATDPCMYCRLIALLLRSVWSNDRDRGRHRIFWFKESSGLRSNNSKWAVLGKQHRRCLCLHQSLEVYLGRYADRFHPWCNRQKTTPDLPGWGCTIQHYLLRSKDWLGRSLIRTPVLAVPESSPCRPPCPSSTMLSFSCSVSPYLSINKDALPQQLRLEIMPCPGDPALSIVLQVKVER